MNWYNVFQIVLVVLNSVAGIWHGSQAQINKQSQIK